MNKIELQKKTKPKKGKIELYLFENKYIGLKKTLFHRIIIPLEPFNSGLDHEPQPVETEIIFEWLELNLKEPSNLDNVKMPFTPSDETEVSVYIGSAHNRCNIQNLTLKKIDDNLFEAECELLVNFEDEDVAENEVYNFKTQLELDSIIKDES